MDFLRHILLYFFIFVCLTIKYQVSSEKCTLRNPNDISKNKLLESISLLTQDRYVSVRNGYTYAVSVCFDISKGNHPNASVTRTLIAKNTTTVLGRYNETDIVSFGENQILLTYSGGDIMNESATCNNTKWKTLIFISCDHKADDIKIDLLDPLNGGCFALFHLKASVFCPARQSAFFILLLVIFVITSSYFVCGILYKRYVEGAKGWDQVPHHEFWQNPLQHLMGCLRGKDEPGAARDPSNDPVDEPLLRP